MGISHLLKNDLNVYQKVTNSDQYGGDTISYTHKGSYKCRIEQLNQFREVYLGRDNTQATHRIYCEPDIYSILIYDEIIVVNNTQYEIISFEDLSEVAINSSLKHVEIYVLFSEHEYLIGD